MKSLQLAILLLIGVVQSHAQTSKNYGLMVVEITKAKRFVSSRVKEVTAIPGADSSWIHQFEENLNESLRLQKHPKKGIYIVNVSYVIDKSGNIADIRCNNDPGFGMGEAVLRLLKKSPKWQPGPHSIKEYRTLRLSVVSNTK